MSDLANEVVKMRAAWYNHVYARAQNASGTGMKVQKENETYDVLATAFNRFCLEWDTWGSELLELETIVRRYTTEPSTTANRNEFEQAIKHWAKVNIEEEEEEEEVGTCSGP